ncbi:MAG: outer membrane beta-barrel protein [Bacteroidia bacterium]|nr:outer membrane beta-barrel protein [Bacteroidia bacterium]
MKKLILVLALLSVITVTYSQKRFNLTFLASPQVSWLKSDSKESEGSGGLLGFGYGVEGDFFLASENYALTTGMTVSTVGGSIIYRSSIPFSGKILPIGTKVDYYITNLEFPLALKMRTKDFNRFRYFAQFGLTNWLSIKSRATTSDRSFIKERIRDEIRFYNIGLNVGAGLEYDLGHSNAITGGLVYSNGFTDVTTNAGINDATTLKVLRIRLGFVF